MCTSEGQRLEVDREIKVVVNGVERKISKDTTVLGLLERLDIKPYGIAVELNLEIVPKGKYVETVLKDGDRIEIVHMVGGG